MNGQFRYLVLREKIAAVADRKVVGPPRINRLVCVECGGMSGLRAAGPRCHRVEDPDEDEEPELAFYCFARNAREFG